MSILFNNNKNNWNIINLSYKKIKLNYLFLNFDFIIYTSFDDYIFLKNIIIKKNLYSIVLNDKFIKASFYLPFFSFLRNNKILCIFIKDILTFIYVIKILENKNIFYSYKRRLSNIISNSIILYEYEKYNTNYIYIQFIFNKMKIKIILIFILLIISLIKYMK